MNKTILLPIATILIASALIPYIQQTDASTIVTFSDQATFLAVTGATCASCPMPDLGFGVSAGTPGADSQGMSRQVLGFPGNSLAVPLRLPVRPVPRLAWWPVGPVLLLA